MPWTFETIQHVFDQSQLETDPSSFDELENNFGLNSRHDFAWLTQHVQDLNAQAGPNARVKLIYASRHGQGYHNVAEQKYGTADWNNKWAFQAGDDEFTWGPDPHLTPFGEEQVQRVNDAWKSMVIKGAPAPTSLYCSPFYRTLQTCQIAFGDLLIEGSLRLRPMVQEWWRERSGKHICDKRSPVSQVRQDFSGFVFDPSMADDDEYYEPDIRETRAQLDERVRAGLSYIFDSDPSLFVSITSHSGLIKGILRVTNHREFDLQPAGLIPIIVKATKVD